MIETETSPTKSPASEVVAERIRGICRYIEANCDVPLRLRELAKRAGLSPFHFQRSFKAVVGLTPKEYVDASRLKILKGGLKGSRPVIQAVFDAGYGSLSGVYSRADTRLGMSPKQYRAGGRDVAISYIGVDSDFGRMMIGATDRGLCFVQFGESDKQLLQSLRREYSSARIEPMQVPHHPDFTKWIDALKRHLRGRQPHLGLPLDVRATAFQMRVWNYLQSIPYGDVRSYGEIASGIGAPKAVRAVARACANNTVAVVIPCHRVIRGTGDLGGYRWGLARKRALIDRERSYSSSTGN
ncbi:MAG: methylated-DNA--[protein]-cysteine S-methyltransferase [Candidatus Eremiobacteraeota bacterium]|nr:methylated-DNA--[protein]-cysteine S-methyltransferase [Candidatus Eremiobacteraeota bacterium]